MKKIHQYKRYVNKNMIYKKVVKVKMNLEQNQEI